MQSASRVVPAEKLAFPSEKLELTEGALAWKSVDIGQRAEKIEAPPTELAPPEGELEVSLLERATAEQKICRARIDVAHTMDTLGWKRSELPLISPRENGIAHAPR
jgi:hypothetical protein